MGNADAIAAIYNAGIEERTATFETRPRTADDVRGWFDGRHPTVVVEDPAGRVLSFATTSAYRPSREAYAGIAEFGVYTAPDARGRGAARLAMAALIAAAEERGFWKLVSRVFVENAASRHLLTALDFREVGVYRRHAQLDGEWRDVVIVELLLGDARDAHQLHHEPT
ncbi:MAG: arsinothricin resistance N-acetyltransferase ArsN1 family A [Candidatus Limnocylindria bacterium]